MSKIKSSQKKVSLSELNNHSTTNKRQALKDLKMLNQLYILLFKKHQNKFDVKDISNVLKKNKWLLKINEKIRQKKI